MDAAVQALGNLGVDLAAEAGQAAERRLDVAAGAAEPVVEIEMAEGGVEVVAPHQAHHAAAEPDAFRVAGRAVDGLGGLGEFVGLALVVLGGVGGCGIGRAPACRLVLGLRSPLWANALPIPISKCKPGNGEVTQNRILNLKHPRRINSPICSALALDRLGRGTAPV